MSEKTEYAPGTFCWVDLGATDVSAAKRFYGELFGWRTEDIPAGPAGAYTMAYCGDKEVAGLYQLTDTERTERSRVQWLSYVAVQNADQSADAAAELGASVLMGVFDVTDAGRMALLQDPTGATVALWQAKRSAGAGRVNEHGTFCWNELATGDVTVAAEFYTRLFGWTTRALDMGPTSYTMLLNGERPAGGMLQMTPEWGDVPPHWIVYFAVDDCDAGAARARSLGADIRVPPTDIPTVGRFSLMQDPQGAVFAIISLRQPPI